MTNEQKEVLNQIPTYVIRQFLEQERNHAFILWSLEDVIGRAENIGSEMPQSVAIDIMGNISKSADCELGITWDTLDFHIEEWIEENTFEVLISEDVSKTDLTVKFCAIYTNENIEEYWNDKDYYFYGLSKK